MGSELLASKIVLASGNDGLSGIADADYVGSIAGQNGIYAGDDVEDLTLLCVPGIATATVQNAMCTYCSVARAGQAFAILDQPASRRPRSSPTWARPRRWRG